MDTQKQRMFLAALNGILSNPFLIERLYGEFKSTDHIDFKERRIRKIVDLANKIAEQSMITNGYLR